MKKMHNHIIYELLALLVLLGIFFVLFNGIYKSENPDNDEYTVSVDSLYINDCMKIIGYLGKKEMILSTAAKYYYEEEYSSMDSILPVVNVIRLDNYKNHELYWIVQGSPIDFSFMDSVSNIEKMGSFVVLYSIGDQRTITYDAIKQMGFNDQSDIFVCQELSWFLLIDPLTTRHILVRKALTENDCKIFFDEFVKEDSFVKIMTCYTDI